jgi:hypothetical protein
VPGRIIIYDLNFFLGLPIFWAGPGPSHLSRSGPEQFWLFWHNLKNAAKFKCLSVHGRLPGNLFFKRPPVNRPWTGLRFPPIFKHNSIVANSPPHAHLETVCFGRRISLDAAGGMDLAKQALAGSFKNRAVVQGPLICFWALSSVFF